MCWPFRQKKDGDTEGLALELKALCDKAEDMLKENPALLGDSSIIKDSLVVADRMHPLQLRLPTHESSRHSAILARAKGLVQKVDSVADAALSEIGNLLAHHMAEPKTAGEGEGADKLTKDLSIFGNAKAFCVIRLH